MMESKTFDHEAAIKQALSNQKDLIEAKCRLANSKLNYKLENMELKSKKTHYAMYTRYVLLKTKPNLLRLLLLPLVYMAAKRFSRNY